ncbi:hypothetical protein, partial [Thermotoga neapolitana]|uniref:hypothetical protein n=1 Tax=Thermotoga neapolitana TaxID=2337 RepID=UPI001E388A68
MKEIISIVTTVLKYFLSSLLTLYKLVYKTLIIAVAGKLAKSIDIMSSDFTYLKRKTFTIKPIIKYEVDE